MVGVEESNILSYLSPSRQRQHNTLSSPMRNPSELSLLNEFSLYTHDYTKDNDRKKLEHNSREQGGAHTNHGARGTEEGGLSFVRLLKRELSRKKVLENGTLTEEYKDTYFQLVELNQTLTKSVNQVKSKMKQYKQLFSSLHEKHEEEMKMHSEQVENIKTRIGDEKIKLEDKRNVIGTMKSEIREISRRIAVLEGEIQRIGEARENAETDTTYKECEIVTVNETCEAYKKRLLQVYKEMEAVLENSKRFAQTKKMFENKIQHLGNTNEKVKTFFEELLLENETCKLELQSLDKVLRAHENICLQLLKIAADKLDSHNDEKVMNEITIVMRHMDDSKEKHLRQMKVIAMNRKPNVNLSNETNQRATENEAAGVGVNDVAQYKVVEVGTERANIGNGDAGFNIEELLVDLD